MKSGFYIYEFHLSKTIWSAVSTHEFHLSKIVWSVSTHKFHLSKIVWRITCELHLCKIVGSVFLGWFI